MLNMIVESFVMLTLVFFYLCIFLVYFLIHIQVLKYSVLTGGHGKNCVHFHVRQIASFHAFQQNDVHVVLQEE